MSETIFLPENATTRAAKYEATLPQLEALLKAEPEPVPSMANVAAVLREVFGFFWVGFYTWTGKELLLGPFQGPLACTRISPEKGVCGAAYSQKKAQLVPDVEAFPGHIACSSASKSEVVIPILSAGEVVAVLDVDSDKLDDFSDIDVRTLEQLCQRMGELLNWQK